MQGVRQILVGGGEQVVQAARGRAGPEIFFRASSSSLGGAKTGSREGSSGRGGGPQLDQKVQHRPDRLSSRAATGMAAKVA